MEETSAADSPENITPRLPRSRFFSLPRVRFLFWLARHLGLDCLCILIFISFLSIVLSSQGGCNICSPQCGLGLLWGSGSVRGQGAPLKCRVQTDSSCWGCCESSLCLQWIDRAMDFTDSKPGNWSVNWLTGITWGTQVKLILLSGLLGYCYKEQTKSSNENYF